MLPILRFLPVGGVFLAILLLVLALKAPGDRPLPASVIAARGALIDPNNHPEWRHVMIEAAIRRADELTRLRDLPDTPTRVGPPVEMVPSVAPAPIETPAPAVKIEPPAQPAANAAPLLEQPPVPLPEATKVAGLPSSRNESDPDADSITGSIDETPGATIPVEIGEASSFELPVVLPEEKPPVLRMPERTKPAHESRRKRPKRAVRAKSQPPKPKPAAQTGLFEDLFTGKTSQQADGRTLSSEAAPRTGPY